MKKFLILTSLFVMTLLFTSCSTMTAATQFAPGTVVVEYTFYDSSNNFRIVYLEGIPYYYLWDNIHSRYYYKPVPRNRWKYIHRHSHPTPPHRGHVGHPTPPRKPMVTPRSSTRTTAKMNPPKRPANPGNHQPRTNNNGGHRNGGRR